MSAETPNLGNEGESQEQSQESFEDWQKRMEKEKELGGKEKGEQLESKEVDSPEDEQFGTVLKMVAEEGERRLKKIEVEQKERGERMEVVALARELSESNERFPFPGINSEDYLKMKETDEEYPGFTTSTDEIIERLKNEGMKVVLGKNPESGNVYILPAGSDDIEMDSISPRQLLIRGIEDGRLKELASKIKQRRQQK